jgi:hypothetical protein
MILSEIIENSIRDFITNNYGRGEVGFISHEIEAISKYVASKLTTTTPIPVTDEMVGRANDVYLGKERTDVFREDYDKMKAALIAALGGDDV